METTSDAVVGFPLRRVGVGSVGASSGAGAASAGGPMAACAEHAAVAMEIVMRMMTAATRRRRLHDGIVFRILVRVIRRQRHRVCVCG